MLLTDSNENIQHCTGRGELDRNTYINTHSGDPTARSTLFKLGPSSVNANAAIWWNTHHMCSTPFTSAPLILHAELWSGCLVKFLANSGAATSSHPANSTNASLLSPEVTSTRRELRDNKAGRPNGGSLDNEGSDGQGRESKAAGWELPFSLSLPDQANPQIVLVCLTLNPG